MLPPLIFIILHTSTSRPKCQPKNYTKKTQLGVDKCGKRWYYNSITCVRGHSWDRLEGEKNVKGLQAGRILTWFPSKNLQQKQWLSWKNRRTHSAPSPSKFCTPPGPKATNRQNSNDFRSKKHNEIKHIHNIHKPESEHSESEVSPSYLHAQSEWASTAVVDSI